MVGSALSNRIGVMKVSFHCQNSTALLIMAEMRRDFPVPTSDVLTRQSALTTGLHLYFFFLFFFLFLFFCQGTNVTLVHPPSIPQNPHTPSFNVTACYVRSCSLRALIGEPIARLDKGVAYFWVNFFGAVIGRSFGGLGSSWKFERSKLASKTLDGVLGGCKWRNRLVVWCLLVCCGARQGGAVREGNWIVDFRNDCSVCKRGARDYGVPGLVLLERIRDNGMQP
ncbi:hypothetical protein IWX50DRAFT_83164 [Phyllosticta citricarpa]